MRFRKSIILIIFIFPALILASELTLEEIPHIPGGVLKSSTFEGREKLNVEYWLFLPRNINSQERAERGYLMAEDYLKLMKANGWKIKSENMQTGGGEFTFRKDILKEAKVRIGVGAKAMEGKMRYYIFIKITLLRLIPFEDKVGVDPMDFPRYPGSVRVRFMNLLGEFGAKYLVLGTAEEVREYFEKKIPEYGWEPSKGIGTLNYIKGGIKNPQEIPQKEKAITKPIEMVKKMIPSTLSVKIEENEGIVEIGVSRSAGSADLGLEKKPQVTPLIKVPKTQKRLLTYINPEKELPIFPGLKRQYFRTQPINIRTGEEIIRIKYEKGPVDMKEALQMADFFLSEMKKQGWSLQDEEWYGIGRRLLFQKGAVKAKISIKAVGRYPLPERAPKIKIPVEIDIILPIPTKETIGEDIKNVPRFPGSVRFYYLKAGIDHIVKFKAQASVEEAEWFFIQELPKQGWVFSGNDKTGLLFIPASFAKSAAEALSKGELIPPTLKVKVDKMGQGIIKIGMDFTKGD